jgi:DNA-binding response OmpR family regulator
MTMNENEPNAKTVLVVDDEATIREVVRSYLERDGFFVVEAADGHAALDAFDDTMPDLIVLDLMLPGVDGLTITRSLRQRYRVPIIMLTARGETSDRIKGLDLGADDYITKPFSPQELVSRVRAVLRRADLSTPDLPQQPLEFDGLSLDPASHSVSVDGKALDLTAREFALLWFMARHPRQVFTRDQLLDQIWGDEFYGDPSTVTVHIRRLREKIERDPSDPRYLVTVWGVGYRFEG